MKGFSGFTKRSQFTPIPNAFFSQLMPKIDSLGELKISLYIIASLYKKRGYPRFVSYSELTKNSALLGSFGHVGMPSEKYLKDALNKTVERGVIISLTLDIEGKSEDIYFLNSEAGRKTMEAIKSGDIELPEMVVMKESSTGAEQMPNIFTLYEDNIGLLTPLISEELKEAEKLYPVEWMEDAIKEAASLNKRNWRYISRILERWSTEGRIDGAHRRDSKKEDPDKYVKGKYGHMVKR
jgi:DnaD/phage-associated family protein